MQLKKINWMKIIITNKMIFTWQIYLVLLLLLLGCSDKITFDNGNVSLQDIQLLKHKDNIYYLTFVAKAKHADEIASIQCQYGDFKFVYNDNNIQVMTLKKISLPANRKIFVSGNAYGIYLEIKDKIKPYSLVNIKLTFNKSAPLKVKAKLITCSKSSNCLLNMFRYF